MTAIGDMPSHQMRREFVLIAQQNREAAETARESEFWEAHYSASATPTETEKLTMSKIYLAARFSRNDEMRGVRDFLVALGHEVTSRWIDLHGGDQQESAAAEVLNSDPASVAHFGRHDLEDLDAADTVISFTGSGGKGGRHIEFGYGLARGKRMVAVGPRENIFHTLPEVEHFQDWRHLALAVSSDYFGGSVPGVRFERSVESSAS